MPYVTAVAAGQSIFNTRFYSTLTGIISVPLPGDFDVDVEGPALKKRYGYKYKLPVTVPVPVVYCTGEPARTVRKAALCCVRYGRPPV
jgi:hypothetical protein